MVQRIGHCLDHALGEIVVSVKTPVTRNGTERPREPLLQLNIGIGWTMCRIGGRLRTGLARGWGVILEIPPFVHLVSNSCTKREQCLVGSLTGVVAS